MDFNAIFRVMSDRELSWKSKGLWSFILSIQTGTRVDLNNIRTEKDGTTAVKSGLKELIDKGYLRRKKMRTNTGFYYSLYTYREGGKPVNWFRTGVECTSEDLAGEIYVLFNKDNELTKIGFTTNLKQRLKGLRSSFPNAEYQFSYPGKKIDEFYLHETFIEKGKNIWGEWFRLDERDIAEIVEYFNLKYVAA